MDDQNVSIRSSTEIAQKLASLSASDVADATGGQGVVSHGLSRLSGCGTVAGRAVTADCAEGSLMAVFAALEQAKPGDVLCMTAPGPFAYLGDLLASDIANRGLAAVVVDGLVRDKDTLASLAVSIHARGVTPAARRGREPGAPMVPITIGGVRVSPGDWIVADSDGVVVIAPADVEAVLRAAEENALLESRIMERVKAGARVMDAVQEVLAAAGRSTSKA